MTSLARSRSLSLISLPHLAIRALNRSAFFGSSSRARAGSSGRAQPSRQLKRSRKTSKPLCQPGGQALKSLPLESSSRGMRKCSSWCPAWVCRTHKIFLWSGSNPAKATRSKASMTSSSCASLIFSSGCHDRTPEVNFHRRSMLSISARVMAGSPRNTCGGRVSLPG